MSYIRLYTTGSKVHSKVTACSWCSKASLSGLENWQKRGWLFQTVPSGRCVCFELSSNCGLREVLKMAIGREIAWRLQGKKANSLKSIHEFVHNYHGGWRTWCNKKKEFWSFFAFLSREEGDPRVHTDDKFLTQTEDDKRHVKYTRHFMAHKSRNYDYFMFR